MVDAPGKKHRKPMRTDPGAKHYGQSGGQDADGKDDGQDAPAPRARVADAMSRALFESGSFLNPEVLFTLAPIWSNSSETDYHSN